MMSRNAAVQVIIEECFWGEYQYDQTSILYNLDEKDERFVLVLISKIVDNADHPSEIIRSLFSIEETRKYLSLLSSHPNTRRERRILEIRTNILGEKTEIPELSWSR